MHDLPSIDLARSCGLENDLARFPNTPDDALSELPEETAVHIYPGRIVTVIKILGECIHACCLDERILNISFLEGLYFRLISHKLHSFDAIEQSLGIELNLLDFRFG